MRLAGASQKMAFHIFYIPVRATELQPTSLSLLYFTNAFLMDPPWNIPSFNCDPLQLFVGCDALCPTVTMWLKIDHSGLKAESSTSALLVSQNACWSGWQRRNWTAKQYRAVAFCGHIMFVHFTIDCSTLYHAYAELQQLIACFKSKVPTHMDT